MYKTEKTESKTSCILTQKIKKTKKIHTNIYENVPDNSTSSFPVSVVNNKGWVERITDGKCKKMSLYLIKAWDTNVWLYKV